jgi:hypothetical protein
MCHRYSGRAKWVASHDVDEFVQPMRPGQTVAEFLHENSDLDYIGAFKILTQWFGSSKDEGERLRIKPLKSCFFLVIRPWDWFISIAALHYMPIPCACPCPRSCE